MIDTGALNSKCLYTENCHNISRACMHVTVCRPTSVLFRQVLCIYILKNFIIVVFLKY